ncbi:helix-turn-helix domain-containing protein [Aminobacter sp. LjRoot7]|uniref:helix-turn-helix domain-containing protein n=1 Tax=Aminobacter sp. LjRoot7 TaxID=3342335 RepID=UPI003ECD42DB
MSERNFSRQFKKQVEMTPADYLEGLRLEAGLRLAEDTTVPDIGFHNDVSFRRSFSRRFGTSPAAYRRCFGS